MARPQYSDIQYWRSSFQTPLFQDVVEQEQVGKKLLDVLIPSFLFLFQTSQDQATEVKHAADVFAGDPAGGLEFVPGGLSK